MIEIERVTAKNWGMLVELFAGSAECSACWCMNHRSSPDMCPTGDRAKEELRRALNSANAYGLLAAMNGLPVGWCAVDPVKTQVGHDYCLQSKPPEKSSAWMIHCLYVDPGHRGAGISTALVAKAIELAKNEGASELLAFPIPEDSNGRFPKDVAEFSGRFSTFKKLGFEPKSRLSAFYHVVAKTL
jgi:GNAT superfamily N-acetyltransferase